jgi:16S rRNA (guanine527-N7)-methyltransferase
MFHVKQFGPDDFARAGNVSRETLDRLRAYIDLLGRWNAKTNLVSPESLKDVWRRHVLDSAQILKFLPKQGPIFDLGSGAGFPGLVIAILGAPEVHLVEADLKKAAFLVEANRITGAGATIHATRIEKLPKITAKAVTARALAPLSALLELSAPLFSLETIGVFLKGQNIALELTEAHKIWRMQVDLHASISDPSGTVVCVREVSRVQSD